jgi:hypothetical protein
MSTRSRRRSLRSPAALLLALPLLAGCEGQPPAPTTVVTQPTPPPTTAAPEPVEVYGCGLPRGTGLGRSCPKAAPQFMDAVNAAIDKTIDEHPELFADLLANSGAYMDEVVENLRRAGFCALNDGEEIALKNSNDFSEQYDVLSSGGHVLRAYMVTCYPAGRDPALRHALVAGCTGGRGDVHLPA